MWPFRKKGQPDPVEEEAARRVSEVESDPPPTLEGWEGAKREDTEVVQVGLDAMKIATDTGTADVTRTSRSLRKVASHSFLPAMPRLVEE